MSVKEEKRKNKRLEIITCRLTRAPPPPPPLDPGLHRSNTKINVNTQVEFEKVHAHGNCRFILRRNCK